MKTMERTQIMLDRPLKRRALRYAQQQQNSLSALVREAMVMYLDVKQKKSGGAAGLVELSKMGIRGGDKNLSERVDEFLYRV